MGTKDLRKNKRKKKGGKPKYRDNSTCNFFSYKLERAVAILVYHELGSLFYWNLVCKQMDYGALEALIKFIFQVKYFLCLGFSPPPKCSVLCYCT